MNTPIFMVDVDPKDFVSFGKVARDRCGEQAQYASRTVDGRLDYPCHGAGLRFASRRGGAVNVGDYHDLLIHKDDVETFVDRFLRHRLDAFVISQETYDALVARKSV